MSDTRAALLQAICENPEDDTARLVYADWLDENDDPERAEYIRLKVGLAAKTVPKNRRSAAEARAEELLERNREAWAGELPRRPGVEWWLQSEPFPRGFANTVGFKHGKAWQAHAAGVFAAAPVSRLRFGSVFSARTAQPVFSSPFLGRITDLSAPPIDAAGAEAFADNPHLTGCLRILRLSPRREDAATVAAALARTGGLRNLESLSFSNATPAAVAALVGSPYLRRLKSFSLHGSPVGDDGAAAIADSPHVTALNYLFLNHTDVADRGLTALARSKYLTSLRTLYLGGHCPITDTGARALATSSGLPRLTDLHLWGSRIGEAGARSLLEFAERRKLRVLNLLDCPIPADLAQDIAERFGPRRSE